VKLSKVLYTTLIIFLFSLTFLGKPAITQEANPNINWISSSFDDHSTSFNPQNAVNKDNAGELEQNWITSLAQENIMFGNETVRTASNPLIVNGIIYIVDRLQILLAMKASDNTILWDQQLHVSNPEKYSVVDETVHARYISYFDGSVWVIDLDCSITAYNGYNGAATVILPPELLCGNISPESKPRNTATRVISAPIFYQEDRILIASTSGLEPEDRSLSYVVGISIDTQDIVWKTSLVTAAGENLSPGWGQWSVDQEDDVIYIGTGSPIPEWNATHRNGANTYSDSIIALEASTGKIIWYYQTNPHDINGYGCNGNIILGDIEGKKTVYSACMNGYLYALDAETGDLVWYFDPPNVKRVNSENSNYVKTNTFDPNKPWLNYPSTDSVVQCPGVFGAVSFNIALGYNTIYMTTFNSCSEINVAPVSSIGETGVIDTSLLYESVGPINSTLYAVDASTGDVKWNIFFDNQAFRGGVTVSGDLIYLPSPAGFLYAFNAENGSQVWERQFGALGIFYPPIIGTDPFGNWTLIQIVAGTPLIHAIGQYSGYMFSFSPPAGAIDTSVTEPETTETDYNLITIYSAIAVAIILLISSTLFYLRRRRS
tara:strand:- start:822 stop:2627 length:1806 start_codon:yes stop_codon:yes gene_type:complete